jgi:hypothetical protein
LIGRMLAAGVYFYFAFSCSRNGRRNGFKTLSLLEWAQNKDGSHTKETVPCHHSESGHEQD